MSLQQNVEIHQGEAVQILLTVWADAAKTTFKNLGGSTIDYRIGSISMDRLILRITDVSQCQWLQHQHRRSQQWGSVDQPAFRGYCSPTCQTLCPSGHRDRQFR